MHKGRLGVAVLLLFAAVFCFSGCNIKSDEKTVFARDTDPAYIDLLRDIAPDCTVRDGKGLSSLLSSVDGEDKAFALFDVQARASKDAGTGGIWYEHFATAAVIAVDRSRFDGEIKGWRDLENISCPVGFTSRYERMLFAAVSYGLEKNYMSGEAVGLLHKLNKSGRLSYGKIDAPVNICWDYQAALMKREGKNIEIIIPSEGTLLYGVGILSGYEMKFSQNAGDAIAAAGFRADKAQGENYPSLSEYGRAERVDDAVEFAKQTENFISVFKRGVFRSRLYSSAESFEHKLLGAAVIMTAIIWMGFALRRVQRKDIRMLVRARRHGYSLDARLYFEISDGREPRYGALSLVCLLCLYDGSAASYAYPVSDDRFLRECSATQDICLLGLCRLCGFAFDGVHKRSARLGF